MCALCAQAKFDAAMAQKKLLEDDATATQARLHTVGVLPDLAELNLSCCMCTIPPRDPLRQTPTDLPVVVQARMDAANALLGALAGEEERWTRQSREFDDIIQRLTGMLRLSPLCEGCSQCGGQSLH